MASYHHLISEERIKLSTRKGLLPNVILTAIFIFRSKLSQFCFVYLKVTKTICSPILSRNLKISFQEHIRRQSTARKRHIILHLHVFRNSGFSKNMYLP